MQNELRDVSVGFTMDVSSRKTFSKAGRKVVEKCKTSACFHIDPSPVVQLLVPKEQLLLLQDM